MYFSRSTENSPFVQRITNDDVLANNIRRELNRSIRYAQYSFDTIKKLASQAAFALTFQEAVYRPHMVTTDYCTVELASAAKLTQCSLRGREVVFHMTHRGL